VKEPEPESPASHIRSKALPLRFGLSPCCGWRETDTTLVLASMLGLVTRESRGQ